MEKSWFFTWLNWANKDVVKVCYKEICLAHHRMSVMRDWSTEENPRSIMQYFVWPEVVLKAIFHSSTPRIHTVCMSNLKIRYCPSLAISEQRGSEALWLNSVSSILCRATCHPVSSPWMEDVLISGPTWCVQPWPGPLYCLSTKHGHMGRDTHTTKPPQTTGSRAWSWITEKPIESVTLGSWCGSHRDVETSSCCCSPTRLVCINVQGNKSLWTNPNHKKIKRIKTGEYKKPHKVWDERSP